MPAERESSDRGPFPSGSRSALSFHVACEGEAGDCVGGERQLREAFVRKQWPG